MKKKTDKITPELVVMVFILLVCLLLFIDGKFVRPISSDAMRFPGVIMIAIVILSAIEAVKDYRKYKASSQEESEEAEAIEPDAAEPAEAKPAKKNLLFSNPRNFLIFLAMTAAYILLIYVFGFLLSSIAFCICFGLIFKFKRKVPLVISSILVSTLLYVTFNTFLKIDLPNGLLLDLIIR